MISYFLLIILTGILGGIISPLLLLPDVVLDPNIAAAFANAGQAIYPVRSVIPNTLTSLFAILIIYLVIEAAINGYKLIKWLYQKIPGIN